MTKTAALSLALALLTVSTALAHPRTQYTSPLFDSGFSAPTWKDIPPRTGTAP